MGSRFFVYNDEDEDPFITECFEDALYTFLQIILNDGEFARLDWSL